jgi:hypothetical protein
MTKREIRKIAADSNTAAIIDRGADVNTQITNLGFEDKGLKTKITEAAQRHLEEGELSIRLEGTKASALVSGAERVDLNMGAEQFPQVREAIDKGLLAGVVDRELRLVLPPADVERAAQVLKQAGINASVVEILSVTAEAIRREETPGFARSPDFVEAFKKLLRCVKREVTFRVKYEKR